MRRLATIATYLFVVMALVIGVAAVPIGAADHLDGPMVMTDGLFDINDVYAFQSPANASNFVIAVTVVPVAGVQNPAMFGTGGAYEIKIDNSATNELVWEGGTLKPIRLFDLPDDLVNPPDDRPFW